MNSTTSILGQVVTLHGNGGTINGMATMTMQITSGQHITFGDLPRAMPPARTPWMRFLGWAFSHIGPVMPAQIMVDSGMTLFARFDDYENMNRRALAQEILNRFHGTSVSGRRILIPQLFNNATNANGLSAFANLTQTAAGQEALRPQFNGDENNSARVGIGGTVPIFESLLRAVLCISDRYDNSIQINALVGTWHYRNSRHYGLHDSSNLSRPLPRLCMAVDLAVNRNNGIVNGTGVTRQSVLAFLEGIGFMTQRNSPNAPARNNYAASGAGVFHLEIWGRS